MRGLLVVGTSSAADPAGAAAALADALKRAHTPARAVSAFSLGGRDADALHAYDSDASPLTAARHAGGEPAPGVLSAQLRERAGGQVLVAAVPGGLLAPITPRFAVRDLARDLGLPVVLAVAATPDLVATARIAAEAARGAGLAVPAIVLTGWPDPPSRVLLDERKLLAELATGAAVHALPAAPAAPAARAGRATKWPVAEWLAASHAGPHPVREPAPPAPPPEPDAARPTSAQIPAPRPPVTTPGFDAAPDAAFVPAAAVAKPAPVATGARIVLEPYVEWTPSAPVGDPRGTPRPRIMATMLEIVAAEGPLRASRAYSLYTKASGGKKVTTVARAPLSSAIYWLAQERKLVLVRKDEIPWQDDDVVRALDSPAVRVRELGPRVLEEVPLDEIAELMARLRDARGVAGESRLKRAVLETYGLVRLTQRADEYLGLAFGLLK